MSVLFYVTRLPFALHLSKNVFSPACFVFQADNEGTKTENKVTQSKNLGIPPVTSPSHKTEKLNANFEGEEEAGGSTSEHLNGKFSVLVRLWILLRSFQRRCRHEG